MLIVNFFEYTIEYNLIEYTINMQCMNENSSIKLVQKCLFLLGMRQNPTIH